MFIVNKEVSKKWCMFEDDPEVGFLIRPISADFYVNRVHEGKSSTVMDQFIYCVLDWKGFNDKKTKKKLEVNDENKQFLYTYSSETINFVFPEIKKLSEEIVKKEETEIKN